MGSQEGAGWAELWVKCGSVLRVALLSSHCSLGLGRSGGAAPRGGVKWKWVACGGQEEQGRCRVPAAGTQSPGAVQTFGV